MPTDLIKEYVNRSSWRSSANANWNYSFSGLQSHIAGTILAKDALAHYGKIGKKHMDGSYHIHNLDAGIYGRYCNGNDTLGLLQKGLYNPSGVSSKPARHFSTALDHIVNMTYIMTGEFAGAQAWRDLDILLAPFVFKDDLDYDDVKQELQEMIWSFSFPMRPSFQTPFINLTFGLKPSKYYKELTPLIGGETYKSISDPERVNTYEDYQDEIDMINHAFLDIMIEGPGDGKPFTFPLPTYNITKSFDWDSEISDKIFQLASKWGTPYFCLSKETDLFIRSRHNNRIRKAKIYTVKIGDEVLTPGGFKSILNVYEYDYNKHLIKIILDNKTYLYCTPNHRLPTSNGLKFVKDLTVDDKIQVDFNGFESEVVGKNDYELGKLLGLIISESNWRKTGCNFPNTDKNLIDFVRKITKDIFMANICEHTNNSGVNVLEINSRSLVGFIEDFVIGNNSFNKSLRGFVFTKSKDFRKGILDGWVAGDAMCTRSKTLADDMCALCVSLGIKIQMRKEYVKNEENNLSHPVMYTMWVCKNKPVYYKEIENKTYVKIKEINKSNSIAKKVFDIEIDDEEHLFTLANGIVTHNSNYINTNLTEEDALSMCCRLRLNLKEVQKVSGGIWNFGANTGSLAVFTVNMPRIGYLSNGDEKKFFVILDKMLEDGKEYLLMKKECIVKGTKLGLFPMTNAYIGNKLAKTYFLTIGINGLNECSVNFCGEDILTNVNWCEEILKHIAQRVLEFQQESGQLFNFEATPGEGCSYSLARLDAEKLPGIFTQGTEKAPYYTGSSLIPSHIEIGILDALEHQERLQKHYTGGAVFHIDMGDDAGCGPDGVRDMIRATCTNRTLPYITWSPSYGVCQTHGKQLGKVKCCSKSEIYSRIVGYYRPVDRYNIGKKEEFSVKKFFKQMKPEDLKPIPFHLDEKGDVVVN